jgi:hypothetical protein
LPSVLLVLLIPVAICDRYQRHTFATDVNDTGGK